MAGAARACTGPRIQFPGKAGKGISLYKKISASVSALRPRGTTLKGWPALGDVYCNVERRRSWTGFKLMHQRAQGPWPEAIRAHTGPRPGRNQHHSTHHWWTSPRRTPRGEGCTAGESRRALTPVGLEPHAGASCPGTLWRKAMGLGCAAACTTPLPAVQPGLVTQDDFTTGRAGGDWDGGTGPTITGTRPARAAGPSTGTGAEGPAY